MNPEKDLMIVTARGKIAEGYCAKRGWNMNELSLEQLLEIRRLPEWKDPLNKKKTV